MNREQMEKRFSAATKSSQVFEAVLYVESGDGAFSESFEYGGRTASSPMIAASITKMFTTACVLKFIEEGKLSFADNVSSFFSKEQLNGLHIFKGHDYSFDLTVSNLLFQTSGLPDKFEEGDIGSLLIEDKYTSFDQVLEITKEQTPHFAPSTENRAHYANVNFDMLGGILAKISGETIADLFEKLIFTPLGMNNTYPIRSEEDFVPHIYYGNQVLERPKTIGSGIASGGCISTPSDLMKFSKAFWSGKLFDKKVLEKLAIYRKVQATKGPICYGGGYMRVSMGGLNTMFMGKGELVGHFGSTGSFMFYYPEKDMHYVGDLSQFKKPAAPFRLLLRLAMIK